MDKVLKVHAAMPPSGNFELRLYTVMLAAVKWHGLALLNLLQFIEMKERGLLIGVKKL